MIIPKFFIKLLFLGLIFQFASAQQPIEEYKDIFVRRLLLTNYTLSNQFKPLSLRQGLITCFVHSTFFLLSHLQCSCVCIKIGGHSVYLSVRYSRELGIRIRFVLQKRCRWVGHQHNTTKTDTTYQACLLRETSSSWSRRSRIWLSTIWSSVASLTT